MDTQTHFCKILRTNMTDAERALWLHLRAHRLKGAKFKRQQAIGPYVVDFVCFEMKLVIELDGSQHTDQQARDDQRTLFLESRGFSVLRFWNDAVLKETQQVLEEILRHLEKD